jgi:CHAT domain-containing protein
LTAIDAMQLPLGNVGLVTLSACESGVGADGLEYATLARAFMHAGAPTVLASLWKVDDEGTFRLMRGFYQSIANGSDRFTALAEAQRALLAGDKHFRDPALWAGFVVYGKP